MRSIKSDKILFFQCIFDKKKIVNHSILLKFPHIDHTHICVDRNDYNG